MESGAINSYMVPQSVPQNTATASPEPAPTETVNPPVEPVSPSNSGDSTQADKRNLVDFLA